jgi:hypothetical protein
VLGNRGRLCRPLLPDHAHRHKHSCQNRHRHYNEQQRGVQGQPLSRAFRRLGVARKACHQIVVADDIIFRASSKVVVNEAFSGIVSSLVKTTATTI